MQSIPPTTADKQTQAQKRRGSRSRKLLGVSGLLLFIIYIEAEDTLPSSPPPYETT